MASILCFSTMDDITIQLLFTNYSFIHNADTVRNALLPIGRLFEEVQAQRSTRHKYFKKKKKYRSKNNTEKYQGLSQTKIHFIDIASNIGHTCLH